MSVGETNERRFYLSYHFKNISGVHKHIINQISYILIVNTNYDKMN